uniref:TIGR02646 family protein n=1 Tax=uncultured Thiotrichaceae bacterium TaxID=298394 RepID=A0A6S6S7G2_9GAMM|nr:MAG: TIGR02646 family protein [uncultured Thiotrichaceae bacterium]
MKKVLKCAEPTVLLTYRQNNPTNIWRQFRRNKARYDEVKGDLIRDQGGLCAYCEIDLKQAPQASDKDDFRVEHFHPKSDQTTGYNWHLDWNNLLGCCHGGSERNVIDAASSAPNRAGRFGCGDHSCDVPKGNNNWDHIILNPLTLPASPLIFVFQRSNGSVSIHPQNCLEAGVSQQQALQTIDNLRLDSPRLQRLRGEVLDQINQNLQSKIQNGMTPDEARRDIARRMLRKNSVGRWPAFFSAIRSYLGQAAEDHLGTIDYRG